MVTSTSTPGSMLMDVICFTTSAGECRSMRRLWMLRRKQHPHDTILNTPDFASEMIHQNLASDAKTWWGVEVGATHRISSLSQVLVPSPHGDLRVVMSRRLVGMRTGPFTFSCLSLAPRIRSAHTAPHPPRLP
jgi:hypothetical protein